MVQFHAWFSPERLGDKLTVHLVLSADVNALSSLDVQQEVGRLFSCEMTKIDFIYLKKKRYKFQER